MERYSVNIIRVRNVSTKYNRAILGGIREMYNSDLVFIS